MSELLGQAGDYVIYADTDSIYLKMEKIVYKIYGGRNPEVNTIIQAMDKVCNDKLLPVMNKCYTDLAAYTHAYAQKMSMKREDLCDKGIWTAKKRYILNVYNSEGVQYSEPKTKIVGLEMIKSSTPSFIRDKMKQTVDIILKGTQDQLYDFIEETRKEFETIDIEQISFPRGVNGLSEYKDDSHIFRKGTPIHVRGALLYNNLIKNKHLDKKYPLIQEGEKLKFVYLKMPNIIKNNIISFPNKLPNELGLHKYVDYKLQFDKVFIEPIKIILNCLQWSTERRNSLF